LRKSDLVEKIKRRLGYPMVKLEIEDATIQDNIDYSRQRFIKWAVGQATQETYHTIMLSGGVGTYDLPGSVVEVLAYETQPFGGVNQLFTISNFMYNAGMFDQMLGRGGGSGGGAASGFTLVSYHIARDFLETVKRYVVDTYTFKYHKYENTLELIPAPLSGSTIEVDGVVYDSPGFILLRCFEVEGTDEDLYENMWVLDYSTALCKKNLGLVRRKFAGFQAIGNMNVQMDGDALMSEANEEITKLDEQLRSEEPYEGWTIMQG